MRRPANQEKVLSRIAAWRAQCPDLTLRSTFIVGFPGETEEDFQLLLDWLEEAELDRVGCFKYEPVDGATSNALSGAVPGEVKDERWNRFMAAQQEISARRLERKVGQTLDVIVDEIGEEFAFARSKGDAPEIDGNVFIAEPSGLKPGDLVRAHIHESDEYDLYGTLA